MTSDKLSSRKQSEADRVERYGRAIAFAIDEDYMEDYRQYDHQARAVLLLVDADLEQARAESSVADAQKSQQTAPVPPAPADPRKAELTMAITGGKLVISIGIDALAVAVEGNPLLEQGENFDGPKVTNPDRFAAEMLRALQAEDEQGTNAIHRVLDEASLAAVEDGAEGILVAGDEEDD